MFYYNIFTIVNYCDPNPCQNGGQCINNLQGHNCNCSSDWKGTDCSQCNVYYTRIVIFHHIINISNVNYITTIPTYIEYSK